MIRLFLACSTVIAILSADSVRSIALPVYSPRLAHAELAEPEYYDPNPTYEFKYGVNDPHTGDFKSQEESLKDGVVHGRYTLAEPDGTLRTVSYSADKENGFNAIVQKEGAAVAAHTPIHEPVAAVEEIHSPHGASTVNLLHPIRRSVQTVPESYSYKSYRKH